MRKLSPPMFKQNKATFPFSPCIDRLRYITDYVIMIAHRKITPKHRTLSTSVSTQPILLLFNVKPTLSYTSSKDIYQDFQDKLLRNFLGLCTNSSLPLSACSFFLFATRCPIPKLNRISTSTIALIRPGRLPSRRGIIVIIFMIRITAKTRLCLASLRCTWGGNRRRRRLHGPLYFLVRLRDFYNSRILITIPRFALDELSLEFFWRNQILRIQWRSIFFGDMTARKWWYPCRVLVYGARSRLFGIVCRFHCQSRASWWSGLYDGSRFAGLL